MTPSLTDIRAAADRIRRHIHRTPVLSCAGIDRLVGARLFFKCENFQKVGAFKIRGATNAVLSLSEQAAAAGVATHSSGNHAAALALAARLRGVPAYVVMPDTAPQVKKEAVAGYGAKITFCAPTLEAREAGLARLVADTGAAFIPPYNDERIIAGQATAALELLAAIPDLDLILTPVGGGGLVSGTALTVRSLSPRSRVIAAEPRGADDAYRSFRAGHIIPSVNPQTIADGLLTSLGDKTFAHHSGLCGRHCDGRGGRHHPSHATDLGADENHCRALGRRPARRAAEPLGRCAGQAGGDYPVGRQCRSGPPALFVSAATSASDAGWLHCGQPSSLREKTTNSDSR